MKKKREGPANEIYTQIAKRIAWCRNKLGLTMKDVSIGTGIKLSSYASKEYGFAASDLDEYRKLATFFNSKWKSAFYNNKQIDQISVSWLMFGFHEEVKSNE